MLYRYENHKAEIDESEEGVGGSDKDDERGSDGEMGFFPWRLLRKECHGDYKKLKSAS